MTMKNDIKIEEELTFRFKIDMKICVLMGSLQPKYNVRAKKVQRSYLS